MEEAEVRRNADRKANQLRNVSIMPDFQEFPAGSVLISFGKTRVLCSVSIEDKVPMFLRDSGEGWVTAEYAMLPGATGSRNARESVRGKQQGRSVEIQRLIGRALRAVVDRTRLGERTWTVDCDVIQADGGTRTASITGAYVALALAVRKLMVSGMLKGNPLRDHVAAISVGIVGNEVLLDLDYPEDSGAAVDLNIIATGSGQLVEVQGTAEGQPFTRGQLDEMITLGLNGIRQLIEIQKQVSGV